MPHIHTEPGQHDHTVSAYIIRYQDDVPYLLLHRHKKYKKLMQPGGHVELNETPWQAMRHEIVEETGYDLSQLKLLQPPVAPLSFRAPNTTVMPMPLLHNSHFVRDPTIDGHYHDDMVYAFVTDELPVQTRRGGIRRISLGQPVATRCTGQRRATGGCRPNCQLCF